MYYLPRLVYLSLGSKTLATSLASRLENRNIVYPFYSWDQTTLFSILFHSLDSFPLCILETHSHPIFSAIFFKWCYSVQYIPNARELSTTSLNFEAVSGNKTNMNKSFLRAKWKRINKYNWQLNNHRGVLYILF